MLSVRAGLMVRLAAALAVAPLGLVPAVGCGESRPAATAEVGTVTAVAGEVTYERPGQPAPVAVTVGLVVTRDMTLVTGAGASLQVTLRNNYVWTLGENRRREVAALRAIDLPRVASATTLGDELGGGETDRTTGAGRHAEPSAAEGATEVRREAGAEAASAGDGAAPADKKEAVEPPPPPEGAPAGGTEPDAPTDTPVVPTRPSGEKRPGTKKGGGVHRKQLGGGGGGGELDRLAARDDPSKPSPKVASPSPDGSVSREAWAAYRTRVIAAVRRACGLTKPVKVVLDVRVGGDGGVEDVRVRAADSDAAATACVVEAARAERILGYQGTGGTLSLPLVIRP